jgi:tRNA uridine 5-carboxymethylaminomethyl modification enzyme
LPPLRHCDRKRSEWEAISFHNIRLLRCYTPRNDGFGVNTPRNDVLEVVEITIKYKGYIERERALADKLIRLENVKIPRGFDFDKLSSVSIEGRQKLRRYQPESIGQASRIAGISPADISVMLVYFGR